MGKPIRVIGAFVDVTNNIEQQKAITRTILQTQEMERNFLGRELHDNINQILASVSLKLGYYLEEPEGNLEIVEGCIRDLRNAIEECRKLSHNMVMPRFAERSLRAELELLIENYSTRQIVWLDSDGFQEENIPSTIKENLFRIAQEQLSNIQKHAKASEIGIQLKNDSKMVGLLIRDNGVGFDIRQKRLGIGITNIFNRAESYNGTAEILSQPGKGCTLSVQIPLALQST
jgi:two-component system sensor histidine kinase UhpB